MTKLYDHRNPDTRSSGTVEAALRKLGGSRRRKLASAVLAWKKRPMYQAYTVMQEGVLRFAEGMTGSSLLEIYIMMTQATTRMVGVAILKTGGQF